MPASSRLPDLFGIGSPLRRVPLTPTDEPATGWQEMWANGMWGGYLTAVTDAANARVRVDLYWPDIRQATIERVYPDGTSYEVRGGDPATMCTAWARWDYEAPLDVEVYYRATSAERDGLTVTTAPLTLASNGIAWLKHPNRPDLNIQIDLRAIGQRDRRPRRAMLHPPERKHPITVYGARQAESGQIVIQVDNTDELAALNAILDDGGDLLLQTPSTWGDFNWYISVVTPSANRLDPMVYDVHVEQIPTIFDVTGRPPGEATGSDGSQYGDLGEDWNTYLQMAASATTYIELSMA